MLKPEEKLDVITTEVWTGVSPIESKIKQCIDIEKRMCHFCNTETYTQDEDCVDCGFSKTYGSRK